MSLNNLITLDSRSNNLDFLRFIAASLVLFSHSYPLFDTHPEPISVLIGVDTGGGLAVAAFFVISGFLVTKSYLRSQSPLSFVINRSLRLFPALIMVTLFAIFLLGPLYTSLSWGEYFDHGLTQNYLKTAWLKIQYALPGVFGDNPLSTVNGSLWTLPVEVLMYVGVFVLGVLGLLTRTMLVAVVAGLLLCHFYLLQYFEQQDVVWFSVIQLKHAAQLGIFFFMGGLFYVFKDKLPMNPVGLVVACLLFAYFCRTPYGPIAYVLTFPYIVLGLGYLKLPWVPSFGRYGDFSYGIYLYAFPVQQAVYASLHQVAGFYTLMLASFVVTLVLAVLSWYLVEKIALGYKHRAYDVLSFGRAGRSREA